MKAGGGPCRQEELCAKALRSDHVAFLMLKEGSEHMATKKFYLDF